VFVGRSDATPVLDPEEVMEVQWVEPQRVLSDMDAAPEQYAAWLKVTLPQTLAQLT
jgi:isopentenyldiphosphate isomerase